MSKYWRLQFFCFYITHETVEKFSSEPLMNQGVNVRRLKQSLLTEKDLEGWKAALNISHGCYLQKLPRPI